jgi:two-component system, NtrC family, response regulator HydG
MTATAAPPLLLVIDDDPGVVSIIERFAQKQGFDVITRSGGRRILEELPTLRPDVALVDLRLPEVGGIDVLRVIREVHPNCHVILMTGEASVDSAIEAVKLGALDYLSKPFDFQRLAGLFDTVRYSLDRRRRLLIADSELASQFEFYGMIGRSPAMQELFDTVRRLAPHVRTALITGETGTGKELVARALHRLGPRRDRRFVAFNCSAIVETLFESEFFGHTRGAFTGATDAKTGLFEQADGGTLFLDEVAELPLAMQPKLLRVVEYGEVQRVGGSGSKRVDVRVIAATNRQLLGEIAAGRFREDLYYRLDIIEFKLPPLREHRDDIPYLTAAFVKEFANRFDKTLVGVSPGAERLLQNAPWPGNVRQLRNVLERGCMLSEGRILTDRDVLSALGGGAAGEVAMAAETAPARLPGHVPPVEHDRDQIERALQQAGGNRSAAARLLGLSRRALYRRLDSFGLR